MFCAAPEVWDPLAPYYCLSFAEVVGCHHRAACDFSCFTASDFVDYCPLLICVAAPEVVDFYPVLLSFSAPGVFDYDPPLLSFSFDCYSPSFCFFSFRSYWVLSPITLFLSQSLKFLMLISYYFLSQPMKFWIFVPYCFVSQPLKLLLSIPHYFVFQPLKLFYYYPLLLCFPAPEGVSPWYDLHGWLGVKTNYLSILKLLISIPYYFFF